MFSVLNEGKTEVHLKQETLSKKNCIGKQEGFRCPPGPHSVCHELNRSTLHVK